MVDAVVATGASIIDMDFFEALGFKHYQGSQFQDDTELRNNYIDRIYDTYIDEEELQACDQTICDVANSLKPKASDVAPKAVAGPIVSSIVTFGEEGCGGGGE